MHYTIYKQQGMNRMKLRFMQIAFFVDVFYKIYKLLNLPIEYLQTERINDFHQLHRAIMTHQRSLKVALLILGVHLSKFIQNFISPKRLMLPVSVSSRFSLDGIAILIDSRCSVCPVLSRMYPSVCISSIVQQACACRLALV